MGRSRVRGWHCPAVAAHSLGQLRAPPGRIGAPVGRVGCRGAKPQEMFEARAEAQKLITWVRLDRGKDELYCSWQGCFDSCGSWELAEQVELCWISGPQRWYCTGLSQLLLPGALPKATSCPNLLASPHAFHLLVHKRCMQRAGVQGHSWWEAPEQEQSGLYWTGNAGGVVAQRGLLQASHKAMCVRIRFLSVETEERLKLSIKQKKWQAWM